MDTIELMADIDRRYREASRLSERRFYSIFYSRIDPSDLMVLGLNPGGDPEIWTEELLCSTAYYDQWEHEYVDCNNYSPIQRAMLPFLMTILNTDQEGVRHVPKTNLVFRRSPGIDLFIKIHLMSFIQALKEAKPYLEEIICYVNPKVFLLEGIQTFDHFVKRFCGVSPSKEPDDVLLAHHRGNQVRIFTADLRRVTCLNREVPVIGVGHPSVFGNKPEFIQAQARTRELVADTLNPPIPRLISQGI